MIGDVIRRYPFPESCFMCGWILSEKLTDALLKYFKKNLHRGVKGGSGGVYNPDSKDSVDLGIEPENFDGCFGEYRDCLFECLKDYLKIYKWANYVREFNILQPYNFQYYKKGGGFKKWHFENNRDPLVAHRHLVFMTYLNDVPNGGTEFYYQRFTTPAIKGLTLIWPTDWTHTHRGQITQEHEKYINTGWFSSKDCINAYGSRGMLG